MSGQGGSSISRRYHDAPRHDAGYAMVALLVGLSIMAVMLSVALPAWRTIAQREREAELVFRGQQYAHAISLFQRKYANAFPPNLDMLVDQKFLRKKYSDPVTGGEFQLLYVGQQQGPAGQAGQQGRAGGLATTPTVTPGTQPGGRAGIMGVSSKSTATSIRVYNGRTKYNEWTFVATQATTRAGAPNASQNPTGGVGGGGGRGAGRQGPIGGLGTPGRGGPTQGDGGGRRGGGSFGGGPLQPFGGRPPGGRF